MFDIPLDIAFCAWPYAYGLSESTAFNRFLHLFINQLNDYLAPNVPGPMLGSEVQRQFSAQIVHGPVEREGLVGPAGEKVGTSLPGVNSRLRCSQAGSSRRGSLRLLGLSFLTCRIESTKIANIY